MIFFRKNRKTEKKLFFCIMNNVFHTSKEIHRRYDLKGSTQGRTTKYANKEFDPTIALKDNDIVDKEEYFIVNQLYEQKLRQQIRADVNFFKENKIIDYSLLIGIHDTTAVPKRREESYISQDSMRSESEAQTPTVQNFSRNLNVPFYEKNEGGLENYNGETIYFMGIIDILTEYNTRKKLEHFFKSLKYGNSISCVPPELYASRFDDFINSRILNPNQYREVAKTISHKPMLCTPIREETSGVEAGREETRNVERRKKSRKSKKNKKAKRKKKDRDRDEEEEEKKEIE